MLDGVTKKFAPLALVPMAEPPEGTVNQLIVFPDEVAFKLEEAPKQMLDGLAVTFVGVAQGALVMFGVWLSQQKKIWGLE